MSALTLEERVGRLEGESEIRRLKARYLNACDRKDPEGMRACFTSDAEIVFPPIGTFNGPDGLIDIFTQLAVNSPIVDTHQGHNAEITFIDNDNAEGFWHLAYTLYDPRNGGFRLLSTFYHDRYVRTPKGWLMKFSRSEPRAIVDGKLEGGSIQAAWVPLP
jgi:hypothetical protein